MKTIVAYFSAGGTTAKLAKTLASAAEAELYEIRPAVPYERRDLNWMDKKSRSTVEMQDPDCRPELQDRNAPVRVGCQVAIVYAVIKGFLDAVAVSDVKKYEQKLFEKLENEYQSWLISIESGEYDENLEHELQKVLAKVQV